MDSSLQSSPHHHNSSRTSTKRKSYGGDDYDQYNSSHPPQGRSRHQSSYGQQQPPRRSYGGGGGSSYPPHNNNNNNNSHQYTSRNHPHVLDDNVRDRLGRSLATCTLDRAPTLATLLMGRDVMPRRDLLISTLVQCIGLLSTQTTAFAYLMAFLTVKDATLGQDILTAVISVLSADVLFLQSADVNGNEVVSDVAKETNMILPSKGEEEDTKLKVETMMEDNTPTVATTNDQEVKTSTLSTSSLSLTPIFYLRLRLSVRFLAESVAVGLVSRHDLLKVLTSLSVMMANNFEDNAVGHNAAASTLYVNDYLARVILEALLYCHKALQSSERQDENSFEADQVKEETEEDLLPRLVSSLKNYMDTRCRTMTFAAVYGNSLVFSDETSHEISSTDVLASMDRLASLWQLYQRVQVEGPSSTSAFDAIVWSRERLEASTRLKSSVSAASDTTSDTTTSRPLCLVWTVNTTTWGLVPLRVEAVSPIEPLYRLFDTESGTVGASLAAMPWCLYYLAKSFMEDVLVAFQPSVTETARQLITLAQDLRGSLVLASSTSIDANAIKEVSASSSSLSLPPRGGSYLMFETLVMTVVSPHRVLPLSFLEAVTISLMETDAISLSPAVATVVELVYRQIGSGMEVSSVDTFVHWFSTLLANIEFKWAWKLWEEEVTSDQEDPQRRFIAAVLERCVRLSYHDALVKVVPASFTCLLPPRATVLSLSSLASTDIPTEVTTRYRAVVELLSNHGTVSDLLSWAKESDMMETDPSTTASASTSSSSYSSLALFLTALSGAAVTFSHARLLVDKYARVLEHLILPSNDKEEDTAHGIPSTQQTLVMHTLMQVWQNCPQQLGIFIDLFLTRNLLSPQVIITVLLADPASFCWAHVWHMLSSLCARLDRDTTSTSTLGEDTVKQACLELVSSTLVVHLEAHAELMSTQGNEEEESYWFVTTLGRWKGFCRTYRQALTPSLSQMVSKVPRLSAAVSQILHRVVA